jgi:UDP-2,3-diacylglucosamine pyrophosphatase LpxH
MVRADMIVISDIHLGSETSRTGELNSFLDQISCKTLILNGDIFDDLRFNRLKSGHWKVLTRLRKLSSKMKVVWIRGNHDTLSAETLSHLLGLEIRGHYDASYGTRRFYAVHGDRWDIFIYKHPRLAHLFTRFHQFLQKHFPKTSEKMARNLKKNNRYLSRNSGAVEYSAFRYAKQMKYDLVFCGHTHMALIKKMDGIVYANSGSWQDDTPHFLAVRGKSVVLYRYSEEKALAKASEQLR